MEELVRAKVAEVPAFGRKAGNDTIDQMAGIAQGMIGKRLQATRDLIV